MATIHVAAGLLTDAAGRVLLVRKQATTAFMQPGGKPEPGEEPDAALVREIHEELGIAVRLDRLLPLGEFETVAANEPGHHLFAHAYAAVLTPAEVAAVAPAAEIAEARWEAPTDAEALDLAPLTRLFLLPIARARAAVGVAVQRLLAAGVEPDVLGVHHPASRRFGIPRRARVEAVGAAWRLGALLVAADGSLAIAGTVVRSQLERQHGYPATSARERAELGVAAERGGVAVGRSVHLDWEPATIGAAPLELHDGEVWLTWAHDAEPVRLTDHLTSRVDLALEQR